jgi:hypothetical protein
LAKKRITIRRTVVVAVGLLMVGSLGPAPVLADIIGTLDENGHGMALVTSTGQMTTFSGANGVDPFDPTSGLTTLIYDIGHTIASPEVVGDVLLVESSGSSIISDLIRFTTDPTSGDDLLILYSLVEPGIHDLADVGIPSSRQTNLLTLPETVGPGGQIGFFDYTPTANQPGYIPLPRSFGLLRIQRDQRRRPRAVEHDPTPHWSVRSGLLWLAEGQIG